MSIVESTILWYQHIRGLPCFKNNFLFYFTQSVTDTVVLYGLENDDIHMQWATLTRKDIQNCTKLPSNLHDIFRIHKNPNGTYTLPGDPGTWTIRTGKSGAKQFIDENEHMLIGLYADIDKSQMEIRSYSKIVIDRKTTSPMIVKLECPERIRTQCRDMGSFSYHNLMTYLST